MYISKKFEDLTISDDFMYQLDKGMDYMQLKQSFVIFVCTFDPFQLGRHVSSGEYPNSSLQLP